MVLETKTAHTPNNIRILHRILSSKMRPAHRPGLLPGILAIRGAMAQPQSQRLSGLLWSCIKKQPTRERAGRKSRTLLIYLVMSKLDLCENALEGFDHG